MISRCRWVSISILGSLFGAAAAPTARSAEPPPTAPYREPFAQSFPYRLEQHLQIKAYAERLPEKRANETPAEATPDFSNIAAYERSLQLYEEERVRPKDERYRDVRRKLDQVKTQVRAK